MTESEAKQKWCPMVRFHVVLHNPFSNKLGDGKIDETTDKCIGSACMMWRESHTDEYFNGMKLQTGQRQYSSLPYEATTHVTHGFCGLAGKP